MAIIATAGTGESFTPAPQGVHQAVCVDVVDKGIHESVWEGQTRRLHKIAISWQIAELRDDGKPFLVSKWYTLSIGEKANLRRDLESWRGRAFTLDEQAKFDVESIIGVNCLLNVQHKDSKGKTYANVVSIMPLVKGMPKMAASADYVRVVNRPKEPDQHEAPAEVHESHTEITDDDIPF
jgi:hypothetical protein